MNLGLETGQAAPRLIAALRPLAETERLWRVREAAKGAVLFAPDEAAEDAFLLLEGLVRLVYLSAEGEAWIKSFIIDTGFFSGADATGEPGAAGYGAECVEPCRYVRLPRAFVQRAAQEDAQVAGAMGAFIGWVAARKQAREAGLLMLSAEARYRAVLDAAPDVLRRLPQGDIARFLGITPVAFSRIKRRVTAG